jgi:PiT family inorganic phosphate transporter
MVAAWVLTVPAAGLVGAIAEETVSAFASATLGVVVVAAITAGILAVLFALARRTNVTADNVLDGIAPAGVIDEPVVPILAAR